MRDLVTRFSPWGRTSRSHYWLIIIASQLVSLAAVSAKDTLGNSACIVVLIGIQLIILVATIRRLHDAARSRWWVMLFFFPMSMTVELLRVHISAGTWDFLSIFPVHLGEANWDFLDMRTIITLIPVFIGLLARSRSAPDPVALQTDTLAV